jgi:uncharacterized protein HemY
MVRFKTVILSAVFAAVLMPQSGMATEDVGYQAIRNHDWATAERQLLVGLEKNPGNVFRQLNLAWVYAQTGRKPEAAAIYRRILMSGQDQTASLPSRESSSVKVLAERGLSLLEMN